MLEVMSKANIHLMISLLVKLKPATQTALFSNQAFSTTQSKVHDD